MKQLVKYSSLDSFAGTFFGFNDTLKVFRTYISKTDVENFELVTLVRTFVGKNNEAHNARADVKALKELFEMKLLILCSA